MIHERKMEAADVFICDPASVNIRPGDSTEKKRRFYYEAYQDIKYRKITEHHKERRMRRMPDFLPVSMQDFLHRGKSDL